MNRKAPLFFGVSLLFLLLSVPAFSQQQDKSVTRLKLENNRLRTIAEDKNTPGEIRELNQQLLAKNENLLREAILKSIFALEDYQAKNADLLDENDRKEINEKIEAHKYDLAQLGVKEIQRPNSEKMTAENASVKTKSVDIPKSVPVSFAEKSDNSANFVVKKPDTAAPITPKSDTAELAANTVPQVSSKVRLISPDKDVTVSKGKIDVVVEVDDGVSEITLVVNGRSKNYSVPADKKLTIPFKLSDTETKIEAFNADDNSERSGEITVMLSSTVASVGISENTYNWGRVRGYFTSGVVFSQTRDLTSTERNNFSKPDIYLDFTLDKNYASRRATNGKVERDLFLFDDINTFFSARLTSAGVAVAPDAAKTKAEPCNSAECTTFLSSEKVARMEAGVYLPRYVTMWDKISDEETDERNKWGNALFIAPLLKGGIQTILGDRNNSTGEGRRFGGDDVYNYFSGGLMVGHVKLNRDKRNFAPELVSFLSITTGRFENFEYLDPDGPKDNAGNLLRRVRPWRVESIGLLKVPETPIVVGFNGNFGKGPDDLRFLFGVRFDIGRVLKVLKVHEAEENPQ